MGAAQQRLFLVLQVVLHAVAVISEVLRLSTKSRCSRCCRHISNSEAPERASCQAQDALWNYAKIAEKQFPMLCTSNLHMLVCRLPWQERTWGHVSKDLEMWVERGVQTMKSGFRQGIHTECPELCHANRLAAWCGLHSDQEGSVEGAVINAAPSGSIPDALQHL